MAEQPTFPCPNGHAASERDLFCADCGAELLPRAQSEAGRTGGELAAAHPMSADGTSSPSVERDQLLTKVLGVVVVVGFIGSLLGVAVNSVTNGDRGSGVQAADTTTPVDLATTAWGQCVTEVADWVESVTYGQAALDAAAMRYGVQSPEFKLIMTSVPIYKRKSYEVGQSQAGMEVLEEVIGPGCQAIYPR